MRFILIPFLLIGCGPEYTPDFVTDLGVRVYLNGHTGFEKAEADANEAYLVNGLPESYDRVIVGRCMSKVAIQILDLEDTCAMAKSCPAGLQYDNLLKLGDMGGSEQFGSVTVSSWIHEEAHWLQECVQNTFDYGHEDTDVWELVNNRGSVLGTL